MNVSHTLQRSTLLHEDTVRACLEHLFIALYSVVPRELLDFIAGADGRIRNQLTPFFAHVRLHPSLIGLLAHYGVSQPHRDWACQSITQPFITPYLICVPACQ